MAKSVTMIPATRSTLSAVISAQDNHSLRRVAAYARVSTDHEEQLSSYEAQVDYYTKYIKSHPDWQFVSVYSDEGVTGCNMKKREGFNNMVADALAGQIDLIITKSVSRFARNTVDTLTTIRKLKEKGVECYFEKENIWTFDPKCELILSILASLSQEESRSISENVTWGHRRRFEAGKASVPFRRFLGYDRGKNGELIVNASQAKIVKRIFAEFLAGSSPYKIAKGLTADSIPTPGGKEIWSGGVVRSILQNEKYKGDALLKDEIRQSFVEIKDTVFSSAELKEELQEKSAQFDTAIEAVKALIQKNARTAIDQNEYNRQYQNAMQTCEQLQSECEKLQQQIQATEIKRRGVEYFLKQLNAMNLVTDFEPSLFTTMVDEVSINPDGEFVFTFIDGSVVDIRN